jgi:rhomboid family GlyGly-CTERM serine protease
MKRLEIIIYAVLIAVVNLLLLFGVGADSMFYTPAKAFGGEAYRFITHLFAHVTWFHLILNGTAFFMLYAMLVEKSSFKRTCYVLVTAAASLAAVTIKMPSLTSIGYCGLSGVAHGLMAITSLEIIFDTGSDTTQKRAGIISLALLVAKSVYEMITGQMMFGFIYGGLIGSPIAVSHIGGVIGGCVMFLTFNCSIKNILQRQPLLTKYRLETIKT